MKKINKKLKIKKANTNKINEKTKQAQIWNKSPGYYYSQNVAIKITKK